MLTAAICPCHLCLSGQEEWMISEWLQAAVMLTHCLNHGPLESLTTEKGQNRQSVQFGKVTDILNV